MIVNHFILTRFNLRLWRQDKNGSPVRTVEWLEHRFALFEKYCLPSVAAQSCKDFQWIVLFDSKTPEAFRERIDGYRAQCPQLVPVFVESENGRFFAEVFRSEVCRLLRPLRQAQGPAQQPTLKQAQGPAQQPTLKQAQGPAQQPRVLTTYLDNDDALAVGFVEDVQKRAAEFPDGTFISYTDGYQYYTDHSYVMWIHYPRNHFVSVVESGNPLILKTIYGYGSHYYIDNIPGSRIECVTSCPLWCEVIHDRNMGNDAYFLHAKMMSDPELMRRDFAVDVTVKSSSGLYLFHFLPRYAKTLFKRVGYKLFGRKW